MTDAVRQFLLISPECLILVMACVILLVGAFFKKSDQLVYGLTQLTLIVAAFLTYHVFGYVNHVGAVYLFYHSFILDRLAIFLKLATYLAAIFCFVFVRTYNREHHLPQNEFFVLSLLSVLGMLVVISANNFLMVYLGLELLSLPIYAMVAFQRTHPRCIEAALKYFLIGSMASGFLLYGMSMMFAVTGSIDLTHVFNSLSSGHTSHLLAVFALIFMVAGTAFKLGAVPFHMWVPDVYDGAPNSVTLFLSTVPKLAAFALIIRLFVYGLAPLHVQWQHLFIVISVLSMAVGNIAAIVQRNLKRMLAYSSIAHMGYMLLGICCVTKIGYSASAFYMTTYTVMTLAAFGMIVLLSRMGFEANDIEDLSGLNSKSPWLAFLMLMVMFSLAGIPPLVGFIAKLGVLEALIEVHQVWLAVVAILFAVVGAYYYIRIIKVMYFEEPKTNLPVICTTETMVIFTVNGLAVLLIGVFPGGLYTICRTLF